MKISLNLIQAAPDLEDALKDAVSAGEYVVRLVEATMKAGDSPNLFEKADWMGTCAHCYAAMSFLNKARSALNKAKEITTNNQVLTRDKKSVKCRKVKTAPKGAVS